MEPKQQWGVSALAYVYRLHTLGRLSEWHYRKLCIQIKSNFGAAEPGPARARETSQVLAKVLTAPKAGGTFTRKDIARHLRIYMRELDEITFGLALTPMIGGRQSPPQRGLGDIRLVK